MAVRGVLTGAVFYQPDRTVLDPPEYRQQNYFVDGVTILGELYSYNAFECSPIASVKSEVSQSFTLTYPATSANISLVEEAIDNRYDIIIIMWRWSDVEGLENPTGFNPYSLTSGVAISGSSDLTTITLEAETYSKTVDADFPGRKIPWTVLSPLSFRG